MDMESHGNGGLDLIEADKLASYIRKGRKNILIIDSRSFLEYNTSHISNSFNACSSKIVKRRLQQDKISTKELITNIIGFDVEPCYDVIVYDQGSPDFKSLPEDSFIAVLLSKLNKSVFNTVSFLIGGFLHFKSIFPDLCEDMKYKGECSLTSLSQPCLPTTNPGLTKILPFLYLGSQQDAYNMELLKNHNITHILNVSTTCPKPDFVQETHFMRIPVNDNYTEKLLPYFPSSFNFLEKVRESGGFALVHCLAGISRSATIAIAYVMQHLNMSSDDAYRYVKSKRPTISPNFNFLGQLLEYERQLRRERLLDPVKLEPSFLSFPTNRQSATKAQKRFCSFSSFTSSQSTHVASTFSSSSKSEIG